MSVLPSGDRGCGERAFLRIAHMEYAFLTPGATEMSQIRFAFVASRASQASSSLPVHPRILRADLGYFFGAFPCRKPVLQRLLAHPDSCADLTKLESRDLQEVERFIW